MRILTLSTVVTTADLLPPLDLKTWIKEREPVPTKR